MDLNSPKTCYQNAESVKFPAQEPEGETEAEHCSARSCSKELICDGVVFCQQTVVNDTTN